jgi:hypothetical protein
VFDRVTAGFERSRGLGRVWYMAVKDSTGVVLSNARIK